jgi:hypothetical protein
MQRLQRLLQPKLVRSFRMTKTDLWLRSCGGCFVIEVFVNAIADLGFLFFIFLSLAFS